MTAIHVIRKSGDVACLMATGRLELLQQLRQPDSASGLARRNQVPRQKVNYHLRELEKAGLIELVEERRKGNCIERVVRAKAQSFVISPEALGILGADRIEAEDRFSSAYLIAASARAIRELAIVRSRADEAKQRLATLTLETEIVFRSAADRNTFAEELANEIARLTAKYHHENAEGGRRFRFFMGGYPAITKKGHESNE